VKIDSIFQEAKAIAENYDITLIEIDRTENIISLDLIIDKDIFIRIYGNVHKNKINLALIFKNQRLYGFDSEGGDYHCHPIENPDNHIFIEERKSIKDFVQESMKYLEEREIL
jgi:uncharacterized membrane protein YjjP (DUF1212 family)